MVRSCIVCCSSSFKNSELSFHLFPKQNNIRVKWLHALHLSEKSLTKNSRVCSKHFSPKDLRGGAGKIFLRDNAIPTRKSKRTFKLIDTGLSSISSGQSLENAIASTSSAASSQHEETLIKNCMSETEQHVQAKSDSLPKIDAWMVADFFYKNHCFSSFETGEVKEEYPERDLYADNSIGFVEVNRNNNICTVRCKMCFEHLAMKKHYTVVLKVNEETNQVISVTCVDCAASATGGCKHAVAFLMWTHRRSEASSPTTVECPLRKPQPAAIETSIKYVTTKDFGAEDPLDVDDGNEFLNDIFHSLKRHKIDSQLVKHLEVKNGADLLDLHGILIRFKENNGRDFFQYCTNIMSDALCIEAASKTVDQYKNDLWLKLRYARITASKLYDVAHCENPDGLIDQILENFCFKDDLVLERSRNVKSLVLKVVENEMKIKLSHTGLLLNKDHPVLCASPDGTSDEYIVEIKYPTSIESMENYITKDNRITAKYNAEVQLEMYFANKCKALYCVADPEFELNSKINIVHIEYNKECVEGLIQRAEFFWLKNILPIVLQSVAHI